MAFVSGLRTRCSGKADNRDVGAEKNLELLQKEFPDAGHQFISISSSSLFFGYALLPFNPLLCCLLGSLAEDAPPEKLWRFARARWRDPNKALVAWQHRKAPSRNVS